MRLVDPKTGRRSDADGAIPRSTYFGRQLVDPETGKLSNDGSTAIPRWKYRKQQCALKSGSASNNLNAAPDSSQDSSQAFKKSRLL